MGRRIQEFREAQDLTQATLAEKTGFAVRTIQKIEAGEITSLSTTVMRIRRVLGCRYDDLMPN